MGGAEYLRLVKINPDTVSHINLADEGRCSHCEIKPCLYVCPSEVFLWDEESCRLKIIWERCLECGACEPACPHANINFHFPRGGYGVTYHM